MCAAPSVQCCTAQSQEEQHGNLQDLRGVGDPALVNLAVRHILQDRNEVRQQEDVGSCEVPQEAGHEYAQIPSGPGSGGLQPLSDSAQMVQTG